MFSDRLVGPTWTMVRLSICWIKRGWMIESVRWSESYLVATGKKNMKGKVHNRREVREGRLHLTFVRVKFGGTKTMKLSLSRLHLPVFLSANRIWRVFYCDQSFNLLCNFLRAVGKLYGALRKLWKNGKSEFNPTLSGQIQVSSPVSSIKVGIFFSWNPNWPVWTSY